MKYDKPTLAILMGALSTIPHEIITRVLATFGFAKYSVYQLTSFMITLDRPNVLLGALCSIILGGVISLIFYYALKLLDFDYLMIKSIGFSLFNWLMLEVIFMWLIEGRGLIPHRPINDYYSEMFGTIAFGISLGLLFRNYLFKDYKKI
ncbi:MULTISPECIES: hypothetical protein [unclassified Dehalobacter]|uniref:hypothetical protein n=1 Tax=unclassified Dehalobacter TaxID=2635733 RepID=UPI0003764678|nr:MULTISPECIES: hypothetical protein [unclassified Dehalobacter]MCG1025747.1 hypothetical protein [Dehalobacter sp.]OCZ54727.1 hypothetical protein A7D23_05150 [Dehalobacter sp. TeCB1]